MVCAALAAQGAADVGEVVVVGDDHPAFAGGDLLVGVEAEDAGAAEGADGSLAAGDGDASAEAFAGVFDEHQLVLLGELFELDHSAGMSEDFDGDDGLGLAV